MRAVRRYLDYGKRIKNRQGIDELYQWIGRILLDENQVYSLEERAMAFAIGACERIADLWEVLVQTEVQTLVIAGPADLTNLFRLLLATDAAPKQQAAFFQLLRERYRRTAAWIEESALSSPVRERFSESACAPLMDGFVRGLQEIDPLCGLASVDPGLEAELERWRRQSEDLQREARELRGDLEFAEDRAARAHQKLKTLDQETADLRRQLRDERENGEKLRSERRTRIKRERESTEARKELSRLKEEYVKLDRRLQQMARRLARAEKARKREGGMTDIQVDLAGLRRLDDLQILGTGTPVSSEELGQLRRRFAAVFHPDRVNQLPVWVRGVCDQILTVVNEACDRLQK